MDIVFIRGLRIETIIGIHDWEKHARRPLILDLEMASDIARAAATDRIADALDYDAVTRRLVHTVSENRFELVETLAEHCAALLREEFGIPWLRLTLNKPGAVGEGVDVGVVIERGERSANKAVGVQPSDASR
ncbi:dihydroneopterin aldolase [Thiocystis violascens]|uniref:Dihydroneopterin aldolase n=1 Tax=Thiocystis violascens (strain ATCC 17096 / DSM 198 / 6111) TaxID=765911 RepID=I3YFY2_THIV6|nr:dihydroneopterin aldolase [Thiocystis violascens]AFL75900.1 FolB domain protein [Thiocystis violascens DSM 198]